jgi:DNA-binding transcriptional MerR regulator
VAPFRVLGLPLQAIKEEIMSRRQDHKEEVRQARAVLEETLKEVDGHDANALIKFAEAYDNYERLQPGEGHNAIRAITDFDKHTMKNKLAAGQFCFGKPKEGEPEMDN